MRRTHLTAWLTNMMQALTIGELSDRYQRSSKFVRLSLATQKAYGISLRCLEPIETKLAAQLTKSEFSKIVETGRDGIPLAPATSISRMSAIRCMLTWAEDEGLIKEIPAFPRIRKTRTDRDVSPWPAADIEKFRALAQAKIDSGQDIQFALDCFDLALLTGQRLGDILLFNRRGWDGETFSFTQQKTGARIRLKPTGRLLEMVQTLDTGRGFLVVIETPHGNSQDARQNRFRYAFDLLRQEAGIKRTFHGLRKNVAVALREQGYSDAQIAALLGHKTTRMVAEYSAGANREKMATECARALSEMTWKGSV